MATATIRSAMQSVASSLEMGEGVTSDREDDCLLDARQVAANLGGAESFIRDHTTRCSPRIPGVKHGMLLRYGTSEV